MQNWNKKSDLIIDVIESLKIESDKLRLNNIKNHYKNCSIDFFDITSKEESKKIGRPTGKYYIISTEDIRYVSDTVKSKYIKIIGECLQKILPKLTSNDEVVIVGLGNQNIESDSLGYLVATNIIVTRNLDKKLRGRWPKISAITPSVMGITGIESFDIINSIANKLKPKCVIVVDSLCASMTKRLGKSIQITNAGIIPGGGVNNPRKVLNKDSLGCDVISVGIPLMIFAKTFCEQACDCEDNLIVTFHDIGEIVNRFCCVVSKAINLSLLGIEKL